jgi:hypothetical protein
MRAAILLCVMFAWSLLSVAQDAPPSSGLAPDQNSISGLLAEHPPELQAGYPSADDLWMLYDWRFDLLSAGAQQFLLQKYGLASGFVDSVETDQKAKLRANGGGTPNAVHTLAATPGANVRVDQALFEVGPRLESETTIAVNGSNILVGFNTWLGQAVTFSKDGGTTWSAGRLPTFPGEIQNAGDPVLAAGPNGRFYHSYLAPNALGLLAVAVSYSDDGGATWNGPINATASLAGSANSLDKDWMAVDNVSGSPFQGNLYVTITRFVANGQNTISLVRSTDGGQTWSSAIDLTSLSAAEAANLQGVQGSFIAIGPNGEVYVSWYDSRVDGIRIVKSTDGGATFSNPVIALSGVGFPFFIYLPGTFDVAAFPQVAVDLTSGPNRGAVYLSANVLAHPAGGRPNLDVMLTHSVDGGATWSQPVRVNSDNTYADQAQPMLAVAANGSVGVAFYDRRNDFNDVLTDVYLAISSDGGNTFPVQQRVTTESWLMLPTPIFYRIGYHGDYNQIVSSGSNFFLSWGDDRDGTDPNAYMAVIPVSGGVPDFTLSSLYPSADVLPGGSATFSFNIGASGARLSATVFPATGIRTQIAGNVLTAATTLSTTPGTYTITVSADNGSIQRSTEVRLTVHPIAVGQVPKPLNYTVDPTYNSQGVVDANGNLHVITNNSVIDRRPKRATYLQVPAAGAAPAPLPVAFVDPLAPDAFVISPRIAVGPDGRIYSAWRVTNKSADDIFVSVSTDHGATFGAPVDISMHSEIISGLPTQAHAYFPNILVGKNGTVFVSYLRENFTTAAASGIPAGVIVRIDIVLIRSTDGGATFSSEVVATKYAQTTPPTATPSVATASPPSLALDSNDNPSVAWAATVLGRGTDIYVAQSRDGGATLQAAVNASGLVNPGITPRTPSIAVDANNVVYLAWAEADTVGGTYDVWLNTSTDGVKYSNPVNLSNATYFAGVESDWPSIMVDASGGIAAAWREWLTTPYRVNDTQRDVFFARCASGGTTCTTPINISTSLGDTLLSAGGSVLQPPGLAVGACGTAYVLYDDDTSGSTQAMLWTQPGPGCPAPK